MIPLFKVRVDKAEYVRLASEAIDNGYIGQGPLVDRFEEELARWLGVEPWQVVTVNSGTSAIMLGLELAGVSRGDTVVSSPITCMADAHAIRDVGADIGWADSYRDGLFCAVGAADRGGPRTKALLVTDLDGRVPNHDNIRHYFGRLPIVQDAAQSMAPEMYGDYVALSFQAIKFLTTGDGGALIVRTTKEKAAEARLRRWFGLDRNSSADFRCQQNITVPAHKWHMTDMCAAMGLANLPGLRAAMDRHIENARWYTDYFEAAHKANPNWYLMDGTRITLCHANQPKATYWTYTLMVNDRDTFMERMTKMGVHVSPVQSIGTKHDLFLHGARLNEAEWYCKHNVAIPSGWWVTDEDRAYIAKCVEQALAT